MHSARWMHLVASLLAAGAWACADKGPGEDSGATGVTDADGDGVLAEDDCDDGDASVLPGADEACNGIDDDCDGQVDEGWYIDADDDGFPAAADRGDTGELPPDCANADVHIADDEAALFDCDDADAEVHPDATEVCNEVDDNCDDEVDEGVTDTWYADNDSDGYPNTDDTTQACERPAGYVAAREDGETDCDDDAFNTRPNAIEEWNGVDEDCSGIVDDLDAASIVAFVGTGDACAQLGLQGTLALVGDVVDESESEGEDAQGDLSVLSRITGDYGRAWLVRGVDVEPLYEGAATTAAVSGLATADLAGEVRNSADRVLQEVVPLRADLDGNGADDLLIRAYGERLGVPGGVGYLVDGGKDLSADADVGVARHAFTEYCVAQGSDHLAKMVPADIDGDGDPGVLVGMLRGDGGITPCADRTSAGVVAWYPAADLTGAHTLDQFDAALMVVGSGDPLYLGQGITAGDFDGDGLAEMVLGAPGDTDDYGAIYIINGADAVAAIAPDDSGGGDTGGGDTGGGDTGTRSFGPGDGLPGGPEDGGDWVQISIEDVALPMPGDALSGRIGDSRSLIAMGDHVGDGTADLIIGPADGNDSGRVYLFTTPEAGVTVDLVDADGTFIGAGDMGFGHAVLADSDVDGDGYDELLIGAPRMPGPGDEASAGRIYIFDIDGLEITGNVDAADAAGWIAGVEGSELGASLAGGADFDGDDQDDVAAGAPGWTQTECDGETIGAGGTADGAVFVFVGWD